MKNALKLLGLSHAQNRTILSRDGWWSARLLFSSATPFTDMISFIREHQMRNTVGFEFHTARFWEKAKKAIVEKQADLRAGDQNAQL